MSHISEQEKKRIAELESITNPSVDQRLELALLCLEPLHNEGRAQSILSDLCKEYPMHFWANYWLARIYLYYFFDKDSLIKAKTILEKLIQSVPQQRGASCELLAFVKRDLGEINTGSPEYIELLCSSIEAEPTWVLNRQSLAESYESIGRNDRAREELLKAKQNHISANSSWSITEKTFEMQITGRASVAAAERIDEKLQNL